MKKLLVVTTSVLGFLAMQGLPVRADDALEQPHVLPVWPRQAKN